MDIEILEDLGLKQAEIKTYLTLLELGQSSAGLIMEKSNLQNSTLHRSLNSLIEKGLISFIMTGKRKIYNATNPENFYDFIDDKKKRFTQILPELKEKQQNNLKTDQNATVFKGRRGITEVYNTLINSGGKEYLTFGGGEQCLNLMGDKWWEIMHRKRLGRKLPARQVWDITVSKFLQHDFMKTPLTKIKFLSADFSDFQETVIAGDYVAITIFTDNPYSVLIKDKIVAQGYKKHFELLWNSAK